MLKKFIWLVIFCSGIYFGLQYWFSTEQFQEFKKEYRNDTFIPPVNYYFGQVGYILAKWDFAVARFSYIVEVYPKSEYAVMANYYLAKTYEEFNMRRAMEEYKKVMELYPDTAYGNLADKRYSVLRTWKS